MSSFKIKESIDKQLYRAFNLASDLAFSLKLTSKKTISKNRAFRDRHLGQRCFVVGTGPSLNELSSSDVSNLSNEKIIAVNSFYKAPIVSSISPQYYALLDNNYWGVASYTFNEIYEKYKDSPPTFITDLRAENAVPEKAFRILLHAKNYPIDRMRYDISGNLSITMNVIGFSLLSAIYMGFKEIYLLGCDYNLFCSRINSHCYDDKSEIDELPTYNLAFYLKYYHLTTEFHYLIASLAQDKNVKIANLTPGSLLDAYPRSTIDLILKEKHSLD